MATDRSKIRLALRNHLNGVTEVATLVSEKRVAWQNRKFEPQTTWPLWLRETIMWGTEVRAASNMLELVAIAQYDLFVPQGSGTEVPEALAKKIADRFKPGTALEGNAQIAIERAEPGTGSESPLGGAVYYGVPVRVSFRAYAPNNE